MRWRAVLVTLCALALPSQALAATSYTDVEDEVMCVSCNVPLNVAESASADAQKAELQRLVDSGLSKQKIKDELVHEYGPRVLALPGSSRCCFLAGGDVAAVSRPRRRRA